MNRAEALALAGPYDLLDQRGGARCDDEGCCVACDGLIIERIGGGRGGHRDGCVAEAQEVRLAELRNKAVELLDAYLECEVCAKLDELRAQAELAERALRWACPNAVPGSGREHQYPTGATGMGMCRACYETYGKHTADCAWSAARAFLAARMEGRD